jgi:hypothetical protein
MKRIGIHRPKVRRRRPGREVLALDPRDPDVIRAKALGRRAHPTRR